MTAGEFVAAWESFGQDGGGVGIYGQRFKSGPELRINQTKPGNQVLPALAGQTGRDFFGAWTSDGQDGSGDAVYGRLF